MFQLQFLDLKPIFSICDTVTDFIFWYLICGISLTVTYFRLCLIHKRIGWPSLAHLKLFFLLHLTYMSNATKKTATYMLYSCHESHGLNDKSALLDWHLDDIPCELARQISSVCLLDKYQLCLSDRPQWWPLWPSLVPRPQTNHSPSISIQCPWSGNMLMVFLYFSLPSITNSFLQLLATSKLLFAPKLLSPSKLLSTFKLVPRPQSNHSPPGISIPGPRSVNMLMGRLPAISNAHLICCKANSLSKTSCFMNWNGVQSIWELIFELQKCRNAISEVCPAYMR